MPSIPVIESRDDLFELVGRIRDAGRFALDLEFLWERTYRPVACLAQVAVGDDVAIVDPIAGAPLDDLAALVADPGIETVMHAPSADLTLLSMHYGTRPANLVDVQLMAGFVGMGAGQSLGALLERVLHVRLAKAESLSDWQRRPLTPGQLRYARDDVAHLLPLADELARRAAALTREAWITEEHDRRYGPDATFTTVPEEACRKVKGIGRLNPRERAILRELAIWRETEASSRDRPPGWLLQDRVLVDLARRRPKDASAMAASRAAERLRPDQARALLAAVARGEAAPEVNGRPSPRQDLLERVEVLGALGQLVVSTRANAARLASQLLATRGEIEAFLLGALAGEVDGPLASGWRREMAGDALLDLASNRVALAPTGRAPYLVEIAHDPES